ncbi:MAG: conjugal transfer protein TrbL family protein [Candidatus Dormibacteria bacterium]
MQPLLGPDQLLNLVGGLLTQLVVRAGTAFSTVTEYYVLWTGNFAAHAGTGNPCLHAFGIVKADPSGCRFTDNSVLRGIYGLTAAIASALLVAVLTYALGRSMFEHSFRARYTLKAMLPRMLIVIVLLTFGLALMQQAVDLNNAAVDAIWTYRGGMSADSNLWRLLLGGQADNVILAVLLFLVAVLLVLLIVTSVARNLLLVVLMAGAPLAFLCMLLPELETYASEWRRLFFTAVFTQVVQVLILRISLLLLFQDHGIVAAIHGLVALYLVLRVPSALHAASHAESKALLYAKHAGHGAIKAIEHATAPEHHVRSHSAAA